MNKIATNDIETRLKRAKLRPTAIRIRLLKTMGAAGKPVSATDLAAAMGEGTTVISVYQAIHRLICGGVVARLNDGRLIARYIRLP